MFLDFKDEEHSKEWSQFFLGKVDAYAQCASAVGERLFEQSSLKEYSPDALQFIGEITTNLIESANESIQQKYPEYKETK
jgi:hypothetical protein